MITKNKADSMWKKLLEHFANAEQVMREIIKTEAWKPLGYNTFAEAWRDRMAEVAIAAELRPQVVYQMLAEGMSTDEIVDGVIGVGPEVVQVLKRQRDNGVPAEDASIVVRRHHRKPSTPLGILRLEVGADKLKIWRAIAQKNSTTVEQVALFVIEREFKEML